MRGRRPGTLARTVAAAAALIALVAALPAHGATIDDRDLARGTLDLKRLVATKHDATAPLRLRLTTYHGWPASLLDGQNRIRFLLNTDREGRYDFVGVVVYRDGGLVMRIWTRQGRLIRSVPVSHPSPDRIRATIPHGIPNPDGNVWIAADERYVGAVDGCTSICHDRIPNTGWLKVTPGS